MKRHFRVLDVAITLSGPGEIVGGIGFAYRRFAVDTADAGAPLQLGVSLDDDAVRVDGRSFPLVPEFDRTAQFYRAFQTALMDAIDTHAVLHAAALQAPDGRVVLLAAPSGHGKSSLTLELAYRGWRFLGDDYAPLELRERRISPYPRAVGIVPDGTAPIPADFREAAGRRDSVRLMDKSLVDVGQVLGEARIAREPTELGHVLLLTSEAAPRPGARSSRVRVAGTIEHADELERAFASTAGVTVEAQGTSDNLRVWTLMLDHAHCPTERLTPLFESDHVVFFETQWEATPEFDSDPRAMPVLRREAAELLGRELLNRRMRGRLLRRYDGSVTRLFLELAGSLAAVRCHRVLVGGYERTADFIQRLIAES